METKIIDLNRATADDLLEASIEGLEEKHISDLVEYREQYGAFANWEDVSDVPGFNRELTDRMRQAGITLGTTETDFSDLSADEFTDR